MTIRRNKEEMKVAVTPVMAEDGTYKIGTWVREDTQGIGTMTYITEMVDSERWDTVLPTWTPELC